MSEKYKHIVLVTDGLNASEPTNETAFNLAKRHNATVTIVDTLKPPTSTARWFSSNASDVFEMVLADKSERLERIAERFRGGGIDTESKILVGKSSEAITREAIGSNADLVVRYMKGTRSKFPGLFGNTARALMRACPSPLLLVGSQPIDEPRVLASIDAEHDDKENAAILAESTRIASDNKNLFGIYCWEMYGSDLVKKRMTDSAFENAVTYAESVYQQVFDDFKSKHDVTPFDDRLRLENGQASTVIPQFCRDESIDIVVMCSVTLNHPLLRLLGSTVESVIDELPCSLLVVKPVGFVSPIRVEEEAKSTA